MGKWRQKFQKETEMWYMFQDYWNLVQEYWCMEDSDDYWSDCIEACKRFTKKYPKYFPTLLMRAFLDEQERKRKKLPDDLGTCLNDKEGGENTDAKTIDIR